MAILSLRFFLGGVLLVAAFAKLTSLNPFERSLSVAYLANERTALPMASTILLAEILVGVALMVSGDLKVAQATLFLGSAFVAFGLWRVLAKVEAPCNCFGPLLATTPLQSLAIASTFTALSVLLYRLVPPTLSGKPR